MKHKIFLMFLGFILIGTVLAQAETGVRVKANVLPMKATMGDEITLLLRVETPEGFVVFAPSAKSRVEPFELKGITALPPIQKETQSVQAFKLTLTAFDLGELTIPPLVLNFKDTSSRVGSIASDPVKIKIVSAANHPKEKDDIRPIKGPISFDLSVIKSIILGVIALLLSALLAVKIILRRHGRLPLDPESLKPAHERVLLELKRLNEKNFLSAGKTKEHYSELSDILRRYLERRFSVEALEYTTSEILKALKAKDLDTDVGKKMKEVLDQADLVKFAKFSPPRLVADALEKDLIQVVDSTKVVETQKEAKK